MSELLHREEIERVEMEKQLSGARLELLKSQINPHFLFNTLNMIACMAKLEEAVRWYQSLSAHLPHRAGQGRGLRGRAGTLDSIFPIGGRTMEQWEAMMGGKTFITDLGEERHAEINGVDTVVGRYAVWSPIRNASRHQIVEVGCDLQALVEKYQIPDSRVCVLA